LALGLYVHVPFCSAICNYCNFNRGLFDAGLKARYVDALVSEIRNPSIHNQSAISNRPSAIPAADTIYFGGGTPSLLEPADVVRIVRACEEAFDVAR
jgi:oxygen-independent coproporphyrinogen-3 oxidase